MKGPSKPAKKPSRASPSKGLPPAKAAKAARKSRTPDRRHRLKPNRHHKGATPQLTGAQRGSQCSSPSPSTTQPPPKAAKPEGLRKAKPGKLRTRSKPRAERPKTAFGRLEPKLPKQKPKKKPKQLTKLSAKTSTKASTKPSAKPSAKVLKPKERTDFSQKRDELKQKLIDLRSQIRRHSLTKEKAAVRIQAWFKGCHVRKHLQEVSVSMISQQQSSFGDADKDLQQILIQDSEMPGTLEDFSPIPNFEPAKQSQNTDFKQLLQAQMDWRLSQKARLADLMLRDLQEMKEMVQHFDSKPGVVQAFEAIIKQRYASIDAIFDDNIEQIQVALTKDPSLWHTVEKPSGLTSELIQSIESECMSQLLQETNEHRIKQDLSRRWQVQHPSLLENEPEIDPIQHSFHCESKQVSEYDSLAEEGPKEHLYSIKPVPEIKEPPKLPEVLRQAKEKELPVVSDMPNVETIISILEEGVYTECVSEAVDSLLLSVDFTNSVADGILDQLLFEEVFTKRSFERAGTSPELALTVMEHTLRQLVELPQQVVAGFLAPVCNDPLHSLAEVQELTLERPIPVLSTVLPKSILKAVLLQNSSQTHKAADRLQWKMIFSAIDEAFQLCRPGGLKGLPMPWSLNFCSGRLQETHEQVFLKVRDFIEEWTYMQTGKIVPPELQEEIDEELLLVLREEKLAHVLALDVIDNEESWVDYEFEETQVTVDAADLLFEHLVTEVIHFL